jgi:hypothetical protein
MRRSLTAVSIAIAALVGTALMPSQAGASTMLTTTFTGTTSKANSMGGTFYVATGAGDVTTTLTFTPKSKRSTMWWRMETTPGDTVVMAGPGASPQINAATVSPGTYGWVVNCVCSATYSLTVTYPAP